MKRSVVLLLVAAALIPACGGSSGGGSLPVLAGNVAPFFDGLKAAVTVGDGLVRLSWAAASDDRDEPGDVRFLVYAAAASGGQNFAAPLAKTAAGATGATVSATIGARTYFVVRALDTEGASDANTVELSIIPLPASARIFVDDSAAGPGTGTFADPFTSVQAGVTAGEALPAGAVILVAAGAYNEQVRLTTTSAQPIHLVGGFPDWSTFGAAPSAAALLSAFDPGANLTTIDGTGLTPYTGATEGLVHVENSGRATFISGLRVSEAEAIAIFGIDVDLSVSGCSFRDPAGGNQMEIGIRLTTSSAAFDNRASIVGNDIQDMNSGGLLFRGAGIEIGGTTARIDIASNFIGRDQVSFASTAGIRTRTEAGEIAAIADPDALVVPTGVTTTISIENNRIFRTSQDGIRLDFEPEAAGSAGQLALTIARNRIEFIDSDDGIDIDDLLNFGDGGSATVLIENNRVVGVSSEFLEVDYVESQSIASATDIDGPTTLTIRGNDTSLTDSGVFEIYDVAPSPGGEARISIISHEASNIESTAFDFDDHSMAFAGPTDGRVVLEIKDSTFHAINGNIPASYSFGVPPGANGLLSAVIQNNFFGSPDDHPIIRLDWDEPMGTNPAGTIFNTSIAVTDNVIDSNYTSTTELIQIRSMSSNGRTVVEASRNTTSSDGTGIDVDHFDRGDAAGPAGSTLIVTRDNNIKSWDEDGIRLWIEATSAGVAEVHVLHNAFLVEDQALDIEIRAGSYGGGRVQTVVYNNRVDASDSGQQFDYEDFTDASSGEVAYALIAQNSFAFGTESSGVELQAGEHGLVLFGRNFVGYGEVDSDDGLELYTSGTNPGRMDIRNNLLAYNPGDALSTNSTIPQILNNTMAFNGMRGSTGERGINALASTPYSAAHVRNTLLYLNGGRDLDDNSLVRATYSLVHDSSPAAGYGNVGGDPLFLLTGGLFEYKTNFQLRPGSPALDAGDPSAHLLDPDGSRSDIGAFGGPWRGEIGAVLPAKPAIPLVVLALARPAGGAPTAPALVDLYTGAASSPFNGANPVNVVFSKPVDPATITAGLAFLVNGAPAGGVFTPSADGHIVTFTPAAAAAAGGVVRIVATSALLSADGDGLAFPYAHEFGIQATATAETEVAGPDSNGTSGTAQALAGPFTSVRVTGTLYDETDPADVYAFTATAGERMQATVLGERIGTAFTSADFQLELLDTDGSTVLTMGNNEFGTVAGNRNDPYIDFVVLATGTYYLRVSPFTVAPGGPYSYELEAFKR